MHWERVVLQKCSKRAGYEVRKAEEEAIHSQFLEYIEILERSMECGHPHGKSRMELLLVSSRCRMGVGGLDTFNSSTGSICVGRWESLALYLRSREPCS